MNEIIDKAIEGLSEQQDRYITEEEAARIETAMKMLNGIHDQFAQDWDARALAMREAQRIDEVTAWDEAHMVNMFYDLGYVRGHVAGHMQGYDKGVADTIIKL